MISISPWNVVEHEYKMARRDNISSAFACLCVWPLRRVDGHFLPTATAQLPSLLLLFVVVVVFYRKCSFNGTDPEQKQTSVTVCQARLRPVGRWPLSRALKRLTSLFNFYKTFTHFSPSRRTRSISSLAGSQPACVSPTGRRHSVLPGDRDELLSRAPPCFSSSSAAAAAHMFFGSFCLTKCGRGALCRPPQAWRGTAAQQHLGQQPACGLQNVQTVTSQRVHLSNPRWPTARQCSNPPNFI